MISFQVVVYMNGVPTKCEVSGGNDCNFEWSSSATPTVTSISPSTGRSLTSLIRSIFI